MGFDKSLNGMKLTVRWLRCREDFATFKPKRDTVGDGDLLLHLLGVSEYFLNRGNSLEDFRNAIVVKW
jgi:hypothetical protein